ncbi:MAG: helix-turn-helix domain-containing protein [Candidatus Sericytochromatia bacterium]|nr:helix-turn-helix domain-containing protein [Candidatus Sericytochromatia bacterium]
MEQQTHILGQQLARLRKQRRLSMQKLADAVGISAAYVCRLEAGDRKPSRELVQKLADVLLSQNQQVEKDELLIAGGFAPVNYRSRNLMGRQDVMALYENILRENPEDFKAYIALVVNHIRSGNLEPAHQMIQEGLARFDDMVQLQALMAALELAKQNFDQAIQFQKEALHYYGVSPEQSRFLNEQDLLLGLGVMHFERGHDETYAAQLARSQKQNTQAKTLEQKAFETLNQAKAIFEQALDLDPADIYILDELARVNFTLAYLLSPEEALPYWQASIVAFEKTVCAPQKEDLGYKPLLQSTAFLGLAYAKAQQFQQAWFTLNVVEACLPNYWLVHYLKACYFGLLFLAEHGNKKKLSTTEQNYLQQALQALEKSAAISDDENRACAEAMLDPDLAPLRKYCTADFDALLKKWGN